jgi:long-chain acyl-CoA synthetase
MDNNDTWPKLLAHNFRVYGDRRKAMRFKHYGIWQSYTWKDYYVEVNYLALGLISLGFKPGDRLLIVGDNAPQWYCAELAAQAEHGVAVGAYADLTTDELAHVAASSQCSLAVVEDQEQADKLLEARNSLPSLKKIIYWNYKGLAHYTDPLLVGYREVLDLGKKIVDSEGPEQFKESIKSGKASDVCALVYTGGTTGSKPKAAVHSFATLRAGAEGYLALNEWRPTDDFVPYLTPAWIHGQLTGVGCHLLAGCALDFAEKPETFQRDTREIEPTVALFAARVWESQAAATQMRLQGVRAFKRLALRIAMPYAKKWAAHKLRGEQMGGFARFVHGLSDIVVFRPIRKSVGLSRVRLCYSTDGLLSPEALDFFHGLSVPINFVYATTEGGVVAGSRPNTVRSEIVGPAVGGAEIRIADDGEIVYRHAGLFLGYFGDQEETDKVLKDGWFYTGDVGALDKEGNLRFTDQAGSLVHLASGKALSPQSLECRLRFSPYIRDAWVFPGPGNKWASVAIVINYENVSRWAGQRRLSFNSFAELSRLPEVRDLIRLDVERINRTLPPGLHLKSFVNLDREFDPDRGETTRTRKLKRERLKESFQPVLEAVYASGSQSLADGQRSLLPTVNSLGGADA